MKVAFNPQVSHTARTEEQKDAEKKVIVGGGAVAASKKGVDMFTSTSQISKGMKATTEATKAVGEVANKSKGAWAKAIEATKWGKDWVLNGASKLKNMRYIKPLVNNKAVQLCAGGVGYLFGAATLISGMSDIGKVVTDTAEKYRA